ncbi:predicted protein [Micromonas commoda]|uniref:AAA+ ATPase domain-containing protein n=1 Tax=Micromonas commoda (strain RCC299 / NOUM17 / CCMP2709) TaxID=296587 RepID=C1DZU5_MICCC|nr:predicted protein [Micromonas commoda]ACO60709.1 predicted protein [Micromonas commoda]|eukprot:XP_002499451.1 predicted protein [Micromonas commoda]
MSGPAPDPDPSIQRELTSRWPGRREQVGQLLGLLGAPHDHALPIFVHGPPVTGKSSIVRDVFTALGRPFAYVSLVDAHGPRLLLDAIVEELRPWLRDSEKPARCDRLADLVSTLRRGIRPDSPAIYLVIDEATRLLDWKGEQQLLPALMKLSELTGRNVGTVLVATPGWDAFRSAAGVRTPMPVFFDAYNDAQLRAILTRELPPNADPALYRNFITSILPMYTATCKSLHELRALLAPLWRRYVKPWEDAKDAIDEARARRREEKENARVSNGTERGDGNVGDGDVGDRDVGDEKSAPGEDGEAERAWEAENLPRLPQSAELFFALTTARGGSSAGNDGGSDHQHQQVAHQKPAKAPYRGRYLHSGLAVPMSPAALALARGAWPVPEDVGVLSGPGLDFDIPRLTKFMLVSAYLATCNSEAVDRRLFGHMVEGRRAGTSAVGTGGGKRRRGALSADRQQEAAASAALEGPRAFSLERLLAYFRMVTKQSYDEAGAGSEDLARELLSADVFMQISSAVALGLLSRVGGADPLESARYRCDIGDDLAQKIAANLRVNLNNYLSYV